VRTLRPVRTLVLGTVAIQREGMLGDMEAAFSRDLLLALLDFRVIELFDLAAFKADQVVVMRAFIQFENRLARLEMITVEQASLLELGQHAVYGRQTDIHVLGQQYLVDVFSSQMAHLAVLENFQDFQARQRRFQAAGFQVGWIMRIMGHVVGDVIAHIRSICFII
jgi:hypothetical protein